MPVRLRLQRMGRKHLPFYRIVATNSKAPRDGKFLEIVGSYNPIPDRHGAKHVVLNIERTKHWLTSGAQPSETVSRLLGASELIPPTPRRYVPHSERTALGQAIHGAADTGDADVDVGGTVTVEAASEGDERLTDKQTPTPS